MGYYTDTYRACERICRKHMENSNKGGSEVLKRVGLSREQVQGMVAAMQPVEYSPIKPAPTHYRYDVKPMPELKHNIRQQRMILARKRFMPLIEWLNNHPGSKAIDACRHFDVPQPNFSRWMKDWAVKVACKGDFNEGKNGPGLNISDSSYTP